MNISGGGGISMDDVIQFLFGSDYSGGASDAGDGALYFASTNLASIWGESD